MNPRYRMLLIWIVGFAVFPALRAAPPPIAQAEISYLLDFVEHSGCQFYRNGTWYDSKTARAHLQSKYEMLAGSGRIDSAEDFIDKAATSSSLSGQPYQVRCDGGEPIASSQWLRDVLSRYRPHDAPRETRGAAGQPHNPILVRVDMNAAQAREVIRSKLSLDLGRDCGILLKKTRSICRACRVISPLAHQAERAGI